MKQDKRFLKDIEANKVLLTDAGGLYSATEAESAFTENRLLINSSQNILSGHTGDTSVHYAKSSINLSDLGSSAHTHTVSNITDFPTNVSYFTNDSGYLTGYTDANTYLTGATVTGTTTKSINLFQSDGSLIQATFTDISGSGGGSSDPITGGTFNTSTGDLDLNTTGTTVTINLDGRYVTGATIDLSAVTVNEVLVGTGSETQWVLTDSPALEYPMYLFNDNIYMVPGVDWSLSGNTITFSGASTPLGSGDVLNIFYNSVSTPLSQLPLINSINDALISHTGDTTIHYTKSSINLSDLGNSAHTHTVSEITDFPTNVSSFTNDSGYLTGYTDTNTYLTGATVTGTTTKSINLFQSDGSLIQATFTDESGSGSTSSATTSFETYYTSGGETEMVLLSTPSAGYPIQVFNNGIYLIEDVDWFLSGATIVFTGNTIPIESGSTLSVYYNDNISPLSTFNEIITGITVSGSTTKTISLAKQDGSLLQATFTDESGSSSPTNLYTAEITITDPTISGGEYSQEILSASSATEVYLVHSLVASARGMSSGTGNTSIAVRYAGDGGSLHSGTFFLSGGGNSVINAAGTATRYIDVTSTSLNIVLTNGTDQSFTGTIKALITYSIITV